MTKEIKVNGRTYKRPGSDGKLSQLQRWYRRRKRKLQWALLLAKNPKKSEYPNYHGQAYEGPEVAVRTLRHAKEVNEHYQAISPPKLSFTPGQRES